MCDLMLSDDGRCPVTDRALQRFGLCATVLCGVLAVHQGLVRGNVAAEWLWVTLAAAFGIAGVVRPRGLYPVYAIVIAITVPLGLLIANVILALIFYLVLTPIALFFRIRGRDVLARRRRTVDSYWKPYSPRQSVG